MHNVILSIVIKSNKFWATSTYGNSVDYNSIHFIALYHNVLESELIRRVATHISANQKVVKWYYVGSYWCIILNFKTWYIILNSRHKMFDHTTMHLNSLSIKWSQHIFDFCPKMINVVSLWISMLIIFHFQLTIFEDVVFYSDFFPSVMCLIYQAIWRYQFVILE